MKTKDKGRNTLNVSILSIYNVYNHEDSFFNSKVCELGENLLEPNAILQRELAKKGIVLHTPDFFKGKTVDATVFMDIPWSILTTQTLKGYFIYLKRKKYKEDYLLRAVRDTSCKKILCMTEPPCVYPLSHMKKYHRYFDKIFTWNDDLVDGRKYIKNPISYFGSKKRYNVPFEQKKFSNMICGNKTSEYVGELYSERKRIIEYMEQANAEFDLFGFGWENEGLKNYKGSIEESKLDVLANYKFSFCLENMSGLNGYITEKMLDCFSAKVIPVYWGAENIEKYVPLKTFIDYRDFNSLDELLRYMKKMSRDEYEEYINNAEEYLNSEKFVDLFSPESFSDRLAKVLLK